ncbi:hypothetical protein LV78_005303 [Actinosynnema pretiosum]|nr:hypothetical protein [Actinosynnema pretiosum]
MLGRGGRRSGTATPRSGVDIDPPTRPYLRHVRQVLASARPCEGVHWHGRVADRWGPHASGPPGWGERVDRVLWTPDELAAWITGMSSGRAWALWAPGVRKWLATADPRAEILAHAGAGRGVPVTAAGVDALGYRCWSAEAIPLAHCPRCNAARPAPPS